MDSTTSKIFTPLFIGTLLNILLLGVTSMQALYYFQTYKRDPIWFRLLVSYLTLAELLNTVCDIAIVYEPLILRYGSPVPFTPKFLPADAVITALISTPVQLFMAWRIKKITKSTLLCALTTFASLCSLAGGIWLSISSLTDSPFNPSQSSKGVDRTPVIIWLAFSGATDLLIIFIVAGSLMKKRKRYDASNDPALDSYLNRVVRLSIQTGSVTAFAVLTELVVFLTINGVPYFFIWDLILSKLYTNCLLTSLNSRPPKGNQKSRLPVPNALFLGESPTTTMQTVSTSLQTEDIMRSRRTSITDSYVELYQLNTSSKSLLSLPPTSKPPVSRNQSPAPRPRYDSSPTHAMLAPFPRTSSVIDINRNTPSSRHKDRKPAIYPPTKDLEVGGQAVTASPMVLESGRGMVYQSSGRF